MKKTFFLFFSHPISDTTYSQAILHGSEIPEVNGHTQCYPHGGKNCVKWAEKAWTSQKNICTCTYEKHVVQLRKRRKMCACAENTCSRCASAGRRANAQKIIVQMHSRDLKHWHSNAQKIVDRCENSKNVQNGKKMWNSFHPHDTLGAPVQMQKNTKNIPNAQKRCETVTIRSQCTENNVDQWNKLRKTPNNVEKTYNCIVGENTYSSEKNLHLCWKGGLVGKCRKPCELCHPLWDNNLAHKFNIALRVTF